MTREEALAQLRNGPGINEDVSEEYNEAVDMAIKALEQEPKWIPCTERLPEENDYRPCTDCEWNDGAVLYCTDMGIVGLGWYYHSTKCWANLDDMWIKKDGKVVAWMPLPEPQK